MADSFITFLLDQKEGCRKRGSDPSTRFPRIMGAENLPSLRTFTVDPHEVLFNVNYGRHAAHMELDLAKEAPNDGPPPASFYSQRPTELPQTCL
jgi:hypothetical protein